MCLTTRPESFLSLRQKVLLHTAAAMIYDISCWTAMHTHNTAAGNLQLRTGRSLPSSSCACSSSSSLARRSTIAAAVARPWFWRFRAFSSTFHNSIKSHSVPAHFVREFYTKLFPLLHHCCSPCPHRFHTLPLVVFPPASLYFLTPGSRRVGTIVTTEIHAHARHIARFYLADCDKIHTKNLVRGVGRVAAVTEKLSFALPPCCHYYPKVGKY